MRIDSDNESVTKLRKDRLKMFLEIDEDVVRISTDVTDPVRGTQISTKERYPYVSV